MAIDETRLKFAPTFWEAPGDSEGAPTDDPRVKQVWFEGAHSDIGGGYAQTGLSDTSLLWMAREAHAEGLVFDAELLGTYVASGSDPICHNPLSLMYRVDNELLEAKEHLPWHEEESEFSHGLRLLTNDRALSVRVAYPAVRHFQEGGYAPNNLAVFASQTNGFEGIVEHVEALPEAGLELSDLGRPTAQGAGSAGTAQSSIWAAPCCLSALSPSRMACSFSWEWPTQSTSSPTTRSGSRLRKDCVGFPGNFLSVTLGSSSNSPVGSTT